jgi:hypothetical protein
VIAAATLSWVTRLALHIAVFAFVLGVGLPTLG